jgi:hypothetical protein
MIHQVLCHDLSHQLVGFMGSLPAVIHQGEGDGLFDVFGFGFFHGGKIAGEQTENKRTPLRAHRLPYRYDRVIRLKPDTE